MRRLMIIVVACVALVEPAPATAARAKQKEVLVRKNVKELLPAERAAFVDAIHRLKAAPSPYDPALSYYDQFVWWHRTLYVCANGSEHDIHRGHGGPSFLPWHRVFVHLFERALSEVSGGPMAVPYWDWSDPQSTASVFADDFMGGNGDPNEGYAVKTGPFRKGAWQLTVEPKGLFYTGSARSHLVRRFGLQPPSLPPVADVAWALSTPRYDVEPFDMRSDPNVSFRNALEGWWRYDPTSTVRFADPALDRMHCGPDGWVLPSRDGGKMHNQVHTWTGGIIADASDGLTVFGTMITSTSPNRPGLLPQPLQHRSPLGEVAGFPRQGFRAGLRGQRCHRPLHRGGHLHAGIRGVDPQARIHVFESR